MILVKTTIIEWNVASWTDRWIFLVNFSLHAAQWISPWSAVELIFAEFFSSLPNVSRDLSSKVSFWYWPNHLINHWFRVPEYPLKKSPRQATLGLGVLRSIFEHSVMKKCLKHILFSLKTIWGHPEDCTAFWGVKVVMRSRLYFEFSSSKNSSSLLAVWYRTRTLPVQTCQWKRAKKQISCISC